MTSSRWLLLLLRSRRVQQRGFGLLIALLAALVTMISAVSLLVRGQAGLLGVAQESQARMARETAEAGVNAVIAELNRPGNRRLLVSPVPFTAWKARANSAVDSTRNSVTNPCLYSDTGSDQDPKPLRRLHTSESLHTMADPDQASVALNSDGSRFRRRFILQRVRISNGDRTRWYQSERGQGPTHSDPNFSETLINFNSAANAGHIELVVVGQLLSANPNDNRVVALATISREFQIVPKCCQLSLGGPAQMFGNDYRWCTTNPPFVVGLGNDREDANGGVDVLLGASAELRLRDQSNEPAPEILCYMPLARNQACPGDTSITDPGKNVTVPVRTDAIQLPALPGLDNDGKPCVKGQADCTNTFKAADAYSIEVFNNDNKAASNDKNDQYAKDYLRVHPNGNYVEICNKKYTPDPDDPSNPNAKDYYAYPASSGVPAKLDTTPEIVADSCVSLQKYCTRLERGGLATYHCRIRNIFVNDFGATNDSNVRQNNTLFIDTSFGAIYLYIYQQWAKTRSEVTSSTPTDPIYTRMKAFRYQLDSPASEFAPIYTVGGYNDGQIQHVLCDPAKYTSVNFACTDTSKSSLEMARAEVISDIVNEGISGQNVNSQDYAALIGDDGFVRDLFFWLPNASFHMAGDPTLLDAGGDLAQGKPQLSAGLWVNTFRFTRQSSEIYLPSRANPFFPYLLSLDDRLAAVVHDWMARTSSFTSLFR
jgi:hypothetical protein